MRVCMYHQLQRVLCSCKCVYLIQCGGGFRVCGVIDREAVAHPTKACPLEYGAAAAALAALLPRVGAVVLAQERVGR